MVITLEKFICVVEAKYVRDRVNKSEVLRM